MDRKRQFYTQNAETVWQQAVFFVAGESIELTHFAAIYT